MKKISLDWKSDFGSKTLGHGTLTCGELRYSPDDQRIFGSAYDASRIWIYNNQYFKGDECISYIPSLAKQTYSHNVLVLIYGYNNNFSEAVKSAVAFAEDFNFSGLLVVWCWPSAGWVSEYDNDLKANAWSRPHFRDFFKDILPTYRAPLISSHTAWEAIYC